MSKTLLNKKQLAKKLQCHPNTVDNYTRDGIIKPRRISARKILYVWEDVARDFGLE